MKVYRGGKASNLYYQTDSMSLVEWAKGWRPGEMLTLDGTIEKSGERHTNFGVEFDEADIVALFQAYLKYIQSENSRLKERVETLQEENDEYFLGTIYSGADRTYG